ncbi:hypothetical protein K8I28_16050 [bacterium]|nr:hypothetical protein [bacterium]
MDLYPRLSAAADMCEAGEEVNLDEMAFLLRYASEELKQVDTLKDEHERLLSSLRNRITARCELLNSAETEKERIQNANLQELEKLDEELDNEVRTRFNTPQFQMDSAAMDHAGNELYRCGR